jgi:hypothetical protein
MTNVIESLGHEVTLSQIARLQIGMEKNKRINNTRNRVESLFHLILGTMASISIPTFLGLKNMVHIPYRDPLLSRTETIYFYFNHFEMLRGDW